MTFAVNIAQSGSNNQTMRNRIINGAMTISQRNGTTAVVCTNQASTFGVDRFSVYRDNASATVTIGQSSNAPTGFINSSIFSVTTGSAPTAANEGQFRHLIEGFNIADFSFGTANAQPVTLSFWVRSSLTGTFAVAFQNGDSSLSYVSTYTISSANTWEYKTVTFTGNTSGTWNTSNGSGLVCVWDLGGGSNFNATPNTWTAGNVYTTSGTTKVMGTTGATWQVTGVQLEEGTAASPFENRLYTTELQLCQRYFTRLGGIAPYTMFGTGMFRNTTTGNIIAVLPVQMRTSPTVTFSAASNFFVSQGSSNVTPSAINIDQPAPLSLMIDATTSATTTGNATRIFAANTTAAVIDSSAEL
jgi:hypothetical protein